MGDCDVALIELDTSRAAAQRPRRLTTQRSLYMSSVAWTRDGSAIIYAAATLTSLSSLWRVTVDGDHAPERIEAGGDLHIAPALARSRDRLAFTSVSLDRDIYRFERDGPVQLVAGSESRRVRAVLTVACRPDREPVRY
jgi:Tol biopolymer transport system component